MHNTVRAANCPKLHVIHVIMITTRDRTHTIQFEARHLQNYGDMYKELCKTDINKIHILNCAHNHIWLIKYKLSARSVERTKSSNSMFSRHSLNRWQNAEKNQSKKTINYRNEGRVERSKHETETEYFTHWIATLHHITLLHVNTAPRNVCVERVHIIMSKKKTQNISHDEDVHVCACWQHL